jgi:hypothetical protein
MNSNDKLHAIAAMRTEIRALTLEVPKGPHMDRARAKAQRARRWANKGKRPGGAQ